jgi:hypothetical protein
MGAKSIEQTLNCEDTDCEGELSRASFLRSDVNERAALHRVRSPFERRRIAH